MELPIENHDQCDPTNMLNDILDLQAEIKRLKEANELLLETIKASKKLFGDQKINVKIFNVSMRLEYGAHVDSILKRVDELKG